MQPLTSFINSRAFNMYELFLKKHGEKTINCNKAAAIMLSYSQNHCELVLVFYFRPIFLPVQSADSIAHQPRPKLRGYCASWQKKKIYISSPAPHRPTLPLGLFSSVSWQQKPDNVWLRNQQAHLWNYKLFFLNPFDYDIFQESNKKKYKSLKAVLCKSSHQFNSFSVRDPPLLPFRRSSFQLNRYGMLL